LAISDSPLFNQSPALSAENTNNMSVQYIEIPQTSQEIRQVQNGHVQGTPTFQVLTIPTDSNTAHSSRSPRRVSQGDMQNMSAVQFLAMPENEMEKQSQQQFVIQLQNGQFPNGLQMLQGNNGMPVQVLSLADGTAFIPIGTTPMHMASTSGSANGSPTDGTNAVYQTIDASQVAQICLTSIGSLVVFENNYWRWCRRRNDGQYVGRPSATAKTRRRPRLCECQAVRTHIKKTSSQGEA
jgi:hypothetical protein